MSPPEPGASSVYLNGAAASSASNVFAVGGYCGCENFSPVVDRWNGSNWADISPAPLAAWEDFFGVATTSATKAWASGTYAPNDVTYEQMAMVEQWNGHTWSLSPTPSVPGFLFDIHPGPASNLWAVGANTVVSGSMYVGDPAAPLIERFNGSHWSLMTAPGASALRSVAVISNSNVWAVGDAGLILHYNGSKWAKVSITGLSSADDLAAITRVGNTTNHLWIVGQGQAGGVSLYYNGSKWTAHPLPQGASAVAAISDSNVWAGNEQWNGSKWTVQAPLPVTDASSGPHVSAMIHVPNVNQIWAVGWSEELGDPGVWAARYK